MYKKVPLTDSIEAKGVQDYIEESCAFLDDARVHSAPVYVHCKAGQSRSVMLVIAYLIHHNQWSFQTSYSYVVERRHTVSPNIGFVAELMAFEERRLKTRRNTTPSLAKTRMEK
jgi:protein-tyrosine phosphatase